ncbi:MAG: molybdenum cofactor guanylyltransferase [Sedimentisphaerales bacterium]|nr:molybdenum cofactor guanylyltransferase [Sedimentisphaerales bacterium]
MYKATAIILAGGQARRMNGTDKSQLVLRSQPLIEHKIEFLARLFEHVVVVNNRRRQIHYHAVRIAIDEKEGCGPLMGVYSGLNASCTEINFVTACDMPFCNERLLQILIESASAGDVVVPMINGYPEPLLAVYNRCVLPHIKQCLAAGNFKMVSFHDHVRVCEIPEDRIKQIDPYLISFININTHEDLQHAKDITEKKIS